MPTAEQKKLRTRKIFDYVEEIRQHGLDIKSIEYDLRSSVLAHALAIDLITVDDVPDRWAQEVNERMLKEEPARIRDTAAFKGTDVHEILERKDNGEIVEVPDAMQNHVEAWRQCRDKYGLRTVETEFTVCSPKYDYMGTGDWIGTSLAYPEWGLICIDYKTSESGIWPDIALQLAAIKYAQFIAQTIVVLDYPDMEIARTIQTDKHEFRAYDLEGNEVRRYIERPMPKIKTCAGVQITDKGYKLVRVNVSEHTHRVFQSAINIARWKTEGEQWALDETAEFVPLAVAS